MAGPTSMTTLETVVECRDLDAMIEWFTVTAGFRIESVSPADDPRDVVVMPADGAGARVRLRRSDRDVAAHLIVRSGSEVEPTLTAPNGTRVERVAEQLGSGSMPNVPAAVPSLSIVRAGHEFGSGRAGMGYRDLLPDRWGGRFIASHIRIADGGDVADYVHFHRIRFQMIYCARGWVDLVYEDQGEPFRLVEGDCVLQPPEIRHRVLRSSPGLEVIEIGCPAVHDTLAEYDLDLPTSIVDPERDFGGQRFVRHVAAAAVRSPHLVDGLVERDTGIGAATDGLAGAVVVEATGAPTGEPNSKPAHSELTHAELTHDGEFAFAVVLRGSVTLSTDVDGARSTAALGTRDAVAIPAGTRWSWSDWSSDVEWLEVTLPAGAVEPVR